MDDDPFRKHIPHFYIRRAPSSRLAKTVASREKESIVDAVPNGAIFIRAESQSRSRERLRIYHFYFAVSSTRQQPKNTIITTVKRVYHDEYHYLCGDQCGLVLLHGLGTSLSLRLRDSAAPVFDRRCPAFRRLGLIPFSFVLVLALLIHSLTVMSCHAMS
jgi:hypothetical protein